MFFYSMGHIDRVEMKFNFTLDFESSMVVMKCNVFDLVNTNSIKMYVCVK